MAIDSASPRTRRALLAAALGAGVATVASALGRPLPARAANGDAVILGAVNTATAITQIAGTNVYAGPALLVTAKNSMAIGAHSDGSSAITASSEGFEAIHAVGNFGGTGVYGSSDSGVGVYGFAGTQGRAATVGHNIGNGAGVQGYSTNQSMTDWELVSPPAKTGVYGAAWQDTTSRGVYGKTVAGRGVLGEATVGTGVRGIVSTGVALSGEATAATGRALATTGRVSFGKVSGIASIAVGMTTVTIKPGVDVTTSSFVLLTPRSDPGSRRLWVTTDAVADTFTIHVSATAVVTLKISWLLVG